MLPNLRIADATGFTYQTYGANSIFNAGQTRVTRRFQRGMSATALYTYSKSIDDASSFTGTGGNVAQYINDWNLERGLSSFDQRHNLSTTYLLSSPVGCSRYQRAMADGKLPALTRGIAERNVLRQPRAHR